MNKAGTLTYETKLDAGGFEKGISKIENVSKKGIGSMANGFQKFNNELKKSITPLDKLTNKIENQQKELGKLKNRYTNVVLQQGKNSTSARILGKQIINLNNDLEKNKRALKNATFDMNKYGQKTSQASSKINSLSVAAGNILADAFWALSRAMTNVIKQGITYNAQIETYKTGLTTLTGSAEKASKIMEQIKEDAKKTPFDVAGLTQGTQLLLSTGLSAERARRDILALGNAIAATGGGNEELSRMAINLQQIKNAGKATALDIRQFAYAGIDIYGLLADYMGITKEEASKMEVTYEDLTGALQKASEQGGRYFNAMSEQAKTFNGQLSNLKEGFLVLAGEAAQPLFNYLKDTAFPIINSMFEGTVKYEQGLIQLTGTITSGLSNAIQSVLEKMPEITQMGINIILALIDGIVKEIPNLTPVFTKAVIQMTNTILNNLDLIIIAGINLILALINGLLQALPRLIGQIPNVISKIFLALTSPRMIAKLLVAGVRLMFALQKGIISSIPKLVTIAPRVIASIASGLYRRVRNTNWRSLGREIVNGIASGLVDFGGFIYSKIKQMVNKMTGAIKKFFKIKSPSRLMRDEIGQWLPKGIAVGIDANTDSALHSIDKMNDEIMARMQNAVNYETIKANASIQGNSFLNTINVAVQTKGDVTLDKTKVGQIITPVVSKTLRTAGVK